MNAEIVNLKNWKEMETHISNLFCWSYLGKINSLLLCDEVSIVLIAENNEMKQFDFDYISQVADNIDFYIETAIEGIKNELEKNPDMFGIKQEQIAEYLDFTNNNFPVSMPNITFYPNKEMYMQFYEAKFPNAEYGFGVGISFKEDTISFVDIPDSDDKIEEDLI